MKKIPTILNKKTGKYEKKCTICKKRREATSEFFPYQDMDTGQLKSACKKCLNKKAKKRKIELTGKIPKGQRVVPTVKCIGTCGESYKHTRQHFYYTDVKAKKLNNRCIKCCKEISKNYRDFGTTVDGIDSNIIRKEVLLFNKLDNKKRIERGLV